MMMTMMMMITAKRRSHSSVTLYCTLPPPPHTSATVDKVCILDWSCPPLLSFPLPVFNTWALLANYHGNRGNRGEVAGMSRGKSGRGSVTALSSRNVQEPFRQCQLYRASSIHTSGKGIRNFISDETGTFSSNPNLIVINTPISKRRALTVFCLAL